MMLSYKAPCTGQGANSGAGKWNNCYFNAPATGAGAKNV